MAGLCCRDSGCPEELAAGNAAAETLDVDAASTLFRVALGRMPTCVASLNGLATVLMGTDDMEGARLALTRSVQLVPEGHAERYMNLAQVHSPPVTHRDCNAAYTAAQRAAPAQLCGDDYEASLRWIHAGVAIFRTELTAASDAAEGSDGAGAPASGKRRKTGSATVSSASASASAEKVAEWVGAMQRLACALCAAAEVPRAPAAAVRCHLSRLVTQERNPGLVCAQVYLNEACDEENAEACCEVAATEALALMDALRSSGHPIVCEPFVTAASLRLSQCRPEDAEPLIETARGIIEVCAAHTHRKSARSQATAPPMFPSPPPILPFCHRPSYPHCHRSRWRRRQARKRSSSRLMPARRAHAC